MKRNKKEKLFLFQMPGQIKNYQGFRRIYQKLKKTSASTAKTVEINRALYVETNINMF